MYTHANGSSLRGRAIPHQSRTTEEMDSKYGYESGVPLELSGGSKRDSDGDESQACIRVSVPRDYCARKMGQSVRAGASILKDIFMALVFVVFLLGLTVIVEAV